MHLYLDGPCVRAEDMGLEVAERFEEEEKAD